MWSRAAGQVLRGISFNSASKTSCLGCNQLISGFFGILFCSQSVKEECWHSLLRKGAVRVNSDCEVIGCYPNVAVCWQ